MLILFCALTLSTAFGLSHRYVTGYTDTAGFMELVNSEPPNLALESDYFSSSVAIFDLTEATNDTVCAKVPFQNTYQQSVFRGHPYLIAIPLSIISEVWPGSPQFYAALVTSLFTWFGIGALILFLMRNVSSLLIRVGVIVLLLTYPVLTLSLAGQPYFDRLLFGPTVFLALHLWELNRKERHDVRWAVLSVVVLMLISERGAMVASLTCVGYNLLLFRKRLWTVREARITFLLGLVAGLWALIWLKMFQSFEYYSSVSLGDIVARAFRTLTEQSPATKNFMFVSLPLLPLVLLSKQLLVIATIAWLAIFAHPVSVLNIDNYVSHYHQIYLPFFVAATAVGAANFDALTGSIRSRNLLRAVGILTCVLLTQFSNQDISTRFQASQSDIAQSIWTPLWSASAQRSESFSTEMMDFWSDKRMGALSSQSISVPEWLMPSAFVAGVKDVEYWPRGVGKVHGVIAPYRDGVPNVFPYADPNQTGAVLAACVARLLASDYQELWRGSLLGNDVAVFMKS